jgi:predicted secreted protein
VVGGGLSWVLPLFFNYQSMEIQSIRIRKSESISISLNYLGLSGYIWDYTIDNENVVRVEKINNTVGAAVISGEISGGTADENFMIHAVEQGNATILFQQCRSWERSKIPHDEMILLVRVIV